jgi:hypothetical protein
MAISRISSESREEKSDIFDKLMQLPRKCPNRRRICSNIELLQISSERSGLRGSGF